jgi:hypothetical protein
MFDKKFFYHPSLFYLFLDPGSGIRDPGSGMGKNQDPGSGIRDKHPGSATLVIAPHVMYISLLYSHIRTFLQLHTVMYGAMDSERCFRPGLILLSSVVNPDPAPEFTMNPDPGF